MGWSKRLQPALEAQLQQFQQAVAEVQADVGQDNAALGRLVMQLGGPEAALLHVQASVYGFFELLQQHSAVTQQLEAPEQGAGDPQSSGHTGARGGTDPSSVSAGGAELLQLCANILHAVSKASELHIFLAVRLLEISLQAEASAVLGSDVAAVEAAQAAEEALVARYGMVREDVMSKLAHLNLSISRQYIV